MINKVLKIFTVALIIVLTPSLIYAGQVADKQKEEILESLERRNTRTNEIFTKFIPKPKTAEAQACLDDLMDISLDKFIVDPFNIWGALYKKVKDSIMKMACTAVEENWNEAMEALAEDIVLPYDLGGISITNENIDWGVTNNDEVAAPQEEINKSVEIIEKMREIEPSLPEEDRNTIHEKIRPPTYQDRPSVLNTDDVSKALKDQFF